ncbi:putative cytochrome P450 [Streptomyces sp. Tu6071]|uniref:cytochrome P450 n=1 Tax=Streptomyces sp. Tu6071 TaxID=355249 RepID=UPI00020E648A|nr:cytochrome P450 [Streptomyces sp. Tu6071]EGJ76437.1 putative cytochrome P450 [Streptomyces sp. Tu6071]
MSEPARDDTSPSRAAARSACPVRPVPNGPGRRDGYLVTGYAEARQALGDVRLSKDTAAFFAGRESTRDPRPALAHHMLASGPPGHTRVRKFVTGTFTTGAVAALRPAIARITDTLLDQWPPGEPFDFVAGPAAPLPVALAALLLVAGHETTTNHLGNALLALLLYAAERDRLRAHPDAVPAALDELLRYDSPVSTATFRFTTEPVTLGGTEIPAGHPVHIALGAANRDPARFAAPDTLDAAGHLAFGHGIHRCLGALAKAEAEIALGAVPRRFPDIRLAVPPEHVRWRRTRPVRGPESLPVRHGQPTP